MREQHGVTGGVPMVKLRSPPSKSAHTPSLSASLGHEPEGLGLGVGFGFGFGLGQEPHALVRVKKRRLRVRKRARAEVFEAMITSLLPLFDN